MAVDIIPEPSEELKTVLYINEKIAELELKSRIESEKLKILRKINEMPVREFPAGHEEDLTVTAISLREVNAEIFRWRAYLSFYPRLCTNCKGSRTVDNSASGQMARICTICNGSGFGRRG